MTLSESTPRERAPGHPYSVRNWTRSRGGCGWMNVVDDSPCGKVPGHEEPHRVYDPYGLGLWIEYDVHTGEETARSLTWGRVLRPRPVVAGRDLNGAPVSVILDDASGAILDWR